MEMEVQSERRPIYLSVGNFRTILIKVLSNFLRVIDVSLEMSKYFKRSIFTWDHLIFLSFE